MIEVEIRLYATLRKYLPELGVGEPLSLNVEDGTMVKQLLEEELSISTGVVKTTFVNGVARGPDYILGDGDRVGIFPPIAGG